MTTIFRKENSLKVLPGEPDPNVPKWKKLAVCGTQTDTTASLNSKYISNKSELKKAAKDLVAERPVKGEGSINSAMQSFLRPELYELKDRRIDVLVSFSSGELWWCQGEVTDMIDDSTVMVYWDPILETEAYKEHTESEQVSEATFVQQRQSGSMEDGH